MSAHAPPLVCAEAGRLGALQPQRGALERRRGLPDAGRLRSQAMARTAMTGPRRAPNRSP
jgi:hypothetical protein